jgi:tripeptidyl-peptidase-1
MGEWIQFTTTVAHANKLFNADYQAFENKQRNITLIRTLAYSLPAALVGHVDTVIPTTSFDAPNTRLAPVPTTVHSEYNRRWTPQSCNSTITPSCLQVCTYTSRTI